LALREPLLDKVLQGARALDAFYFCLNGTRTLTTNSLGGAVLTDEGNLTSTLQSNVSFKLLLCSFQLVKSMAVPHLRIQAARQDGARG
jgi:hypothetical protein